MRTWMPLLIQLFLTVLVFWVIYPLATFVMKSAPPTAARALAVLALRERKP